MAAIEISSRPALTSLSKSGKEENLGNMAHAESRLKLLPNTMARLMLPLADKKEGEITPAFLGLKQLKSISGMICQA
jgi:hypothetical protein